MAIYFFDKDQTLIKIVPESATFEAIQTQELDDDSLLKDILSGTVKGDEKLLDAEYMAVKSYEGNAQVLDMYRIVNDITPNKSMSFTGMSLAPYELNGHIIQDLRPTNQTLSYTLNRVLDGTDWRVGHIDDGLSNVTTTFYYVSAKEALKELQSLVGCEFVFKVEISGQKITDKWIEVYKEMGNRTKKRFNYGTNALTVVRETNKTEIYTALIGRGKGEEVSSADDNASGQAGYGRKITFEDIEWSTTKGNPLNKPIGQYYLELPQATQAYGIKNIDGTMTPRIGIVDFDDEEDKNRLINLTYQQLLVSSRPKVLFKTTVANIGATGIGDTVTIHRHDLNIHYQTRVRKIVRDKLNDNKTQIELGDAVVTPSTKRAKQNNATIKNLNQELEKVKADIVISQTSADGKNTINYGSTEPERKRTGDTWYRPHPSIAGETQMLVWNGNAWELVLDSSDLSSVAREVEDAINKAEDAKALAVSEAEQALVDANKYADAKAEAIKQQVSTSVDTAISTAENAKQAAEASYTNAVADAQALVEAQSTAFNEKFEENATSISNLSQAAKDADAKAQSALSKAGANANLLNTHQNTLNTINNTTIPDIRSTAGTALSNAKNAMDEAKLADTKIANYATQKGLVSGTTVDSKINTATGEISRKITTVESKIPTEIGGRNYLLNSGKPTALTINSNNYAVYPITKGVENGVDWFYQTYTDGTDIFMISTYVGEIYTDTSTYGRKFSKDLEGYDGIITYSVDVMAEQPITLRLNLSGAGRNNQTTLVPNKWTRLITTMPITDNNRPMAFMADASDNIDIPVGTKLYWKNYKIEKGSIATDHSEAPEDNLSQSEFQIFESTYDETVKGINSTLTDLSTKKLDSTTYTTFYTNEYKQTAQGVTDTYTKVNKIIDANGNSTDAFAKAVYDKNAQRQSAAFQEVTRDLVTTTKYEAGINGINQSISTIRGDLDNLRIGGRNLLLESEAETIVTSYATRYNDNALVSELVDGETYTLSFDAKSNTATNFRQNLFINNGTSGSVTPDTVITPQYKRFTSTFVFSKKLYNGHSIYLHLYPNITGALYIRRVKLEKGNIATDWSPAPEDMLGQADFQIFKNDYDETSKGILSRLTAIDSSDEGSVVTRLNKTESTASGNSKLITTINNNYVKQSNIDESILADKKIKDTRSTNQLPNWYFTNYPAQEIREFKQVSTMGIGSGTYGVLTTNVPWSGSSGGPVKQTFETNDGIHTRQGNSAATAWGSWVKQVDTADATYQKITERSNLYERVIGSSSEASVKQNMSRIVMTDSAFQTEVIDKQNLLAAMASGTGMTRDPYFEKSNNDIGVYDNGRTGTITIKRVAIPSNTSIPVPKGSTGYRLDITHADSTATTPNRGGIVCNTNSWANGTVVVKFVALLPTGRSFAQANNPLGTGSTVGWLTDNKGTGKWETYMYYYRFGSSGTFSTFGHLSVTGASTAFTWYLSEYDIINVNETAASKITQLAYNINLKVSKADLISEINLSTEGVRIAGKNIQLDGNVYMTQYFQVPNANIKDLAVDKLTGTNAQFTTMITKGLTADTITSTMIKADTALFDMLFSTTSATTRLVARGAWITNANIVSLDASKITAGTIATARLDSGAIVTAGLSANVVKSTHIQSDTALVDKIFSADAYITRLTSKAAFISAIQAVSISASNITSGTLDASKAKVINLDANNITANKTTFVQSAWNDINSQVSIDGSGIKTQNTNGDFSRIISGELRSYNGDSSSTAILGSGRSQYFDKSGSQFILGNTLHGNEWLNDGTLQVTHNRRFAIGRYADYAVNNGLFHPYIALEYPPGKTGDEPQGLVRFYKAIYLQKDIYANNNAVTGLSKITFNNGGNIESQSSTSNLLIGASNKLVVYASGANAFEIDSGYMYLRRNLSMEGNKITNQSDRRLKINIVDTPVNSLSAISKWNFKAFDRVNNNIHDDIGLIAQDTSDIVVYDEENDMYYVDSSKQIMMNSHGIQQLNTKVDDEIAQLRAQIASLQKELATLKGE